MNAKSKKLQGNGRWESSRLMLPEHREQYLQLMERDRIKAAGLKIESPPVSQAELELMHDFVLLPMAYTIAEKNRKEIEQKARSLRDLFIKATIIILQQMKADIENINQSLKQAIITVLSGNLIDNIATYSYKCRSHDGTFALTREYERVHIGKLIARYINGLFPPIKKTPK
jgi:hypothetical protein